MDTPLGDHSSLTITSLPIEPTVKTTKSITTTMSVDSHQWFQSVVIGIQFILLLALIIALYYAINKLWHFLAKVIDLLDKTNTKQELIDQSLHGSIDDNINKKSLFHKLTPELSDHQLSIKSNNGSKSKTSHSTPKSEPKPQTICLKTIPEEVPTERSHHLPPQPIRPETTTDETHVDLNTVSMLNWLRLNRTDGTGSSGGDSSVLDDTRHQINSILNESFDDMIETVINMNDQTLRYDDSSSD